MKYQVIIPIFNEEKSLVELCDRIFEVFGSIGEQHNFEILFVDDGSIDSSREIIRELWQTRNYVSGVLLRKNMGKSFALMAGFINSDAEFVITMDGDLQDNPEDILKMIEKINEGNDLVTGWKEQRQDNVLRIVVSRLFNFLVSRISGLYLHDFNCGFKIYRSNVIKNLCIYGHYHRFLPLLVYFQGFKVTEISINHSKRKYGSSKYPLFRYQGFFDLLSILFNFKYRFSPLHFFGILGALLIIPASFVFLFIIIKHTLFVLGLGEDYIEKIKLLLPLSVTILLVGLNIFLTGLVCDFILQFQRRQIVSSVEQGIGDLLRSKNSIEVIKKKVIISNS